MRGCSPTGTAPLDHVDGRQLLGMDIATLRQLADERPSTGRSIATPRTFAAGSRFRRATPFLTERVPRMLAARRDPNYPTVLRAPRGAVRDAGTLD